MRYYLTSIRMVILKKKDNNKFRQGYGEVGILLCYWWGYKMEKTL